MKETKEFCKRKSSIFTENSMITNALKNSLVFEYVGLYTIEIRRFPIQDPSKIPKSHFKDTYVLDLGSWYNSRNSIGI